MKDEINDWDIGRAGRNWTGTEGLVKLERLPGRLELMHGKLCFTEAERRILLAGLLENIGLDEVVKLGNIEDWQQAIAAREEANAERELADSGGDQVPDRYWNCRVIEFPYDDETWYAIHEVHYAHGKPIGYTTEPATPGWSSSDDPGGALRQLARFREALRKPFLKVSDFEYDTGDPDSEVAERAMRTGEARLVAWTQDGTLVPGFAVQTAWSITSQALDEMRAAGLVAEVFVRDQPWYVAGTLALERTDAIAIVRALGNQSPVAKLIFFMRTHGALSGDTVIEAVQDGRLEDVLRLARASLVQ